MSIIHRPPQDFKLPAACTTGMHIWWLHWLAIFLEKFEMNDEDHHPMGYLHFENFGRCTSWAFGDDHTRRLKKEYMFAEKFIEDYTRNGKQLKFQDLLKHYKDNYRNYR